ncbi:hypothetical protein CEK62_06540 [Alcanivorax sp. N3-2A]|nr:hypothetical protein CEK62_06540 [Alcanivorax sp. N3-2A]|tara:strand:- start:24694 stop:26805 length:2112 start_codon:yes stop_codon:yes gene_type:complete
MTRVTPAYPAKRRHAACLALLALALLSAGPTFGNGPPGFPDNSRAWRLVGAGEVLDAEVPAVRHGESVLAWSEPLQAANAMEILVQAPYARLRPALGEALAEIGITLTDTTSPLAYQREGWGAVMMSRHPAWRAAVVADNSEPRLRAALADGAIGEQELQTRLARERADAFSVPQARIKVAELQRQYASAHGGKTRRYGLLRRSSTELIVHLDDAGEALGLPATAIRIQRTDTYPNPNYHWRDLFDLFGGQRPSLTRGLVPAEALRAVLAAIDASAPEAAVRFNQTPTPWVAPVTSPEPPPRADFRRPDAAAPVLQPDTLDWRALLGATDRDSYLPRALITLPGSDLLIAARVRDDRGVSVGLWRLSPDQPQVRLLWRGARGLRQLYLDEKGQQVWFLAAPEAGQPMQLYRYRPADQSLDAFPTHFSDPQEPDFDTAVVWRLGEDSLPRFYHHHLGLGARTRDTLDRYDPVGEPARPWRFSRAARATRADMVPGRLRLAHWRGAGWWVEDSTSLARLNTGNGRVETVIALPHRFGHPGDDQEQFGRTGRIPALGAPSAGWLATTFERDGSGQSGSGQRSSQLKSNEGGRLNGMRITGLSGDTASFSAVLGDAPVLAAARSGGGALLAMAADAGPRQPASLALWDIQRAVTPVQPRGGAWGAPKALTFSWRGDTLWALYNQVLVRWRLPGALADPGAPDQSNDP